MKNNNDQAMENYFASMLREETPQKVMPKTLTDDVHEQLEGLRSAVPVLPETLIFSESETEVETDRAFVSDDIHLWDEFVWHPNPDRVDRFVKADSPRVRTEPRRVKSTGQ